MDDKNRLVYNGLQIVLDQVNAAYPKAITNIEISTSNLIANSDFGKLTDYQSKVSEYLNYIHSKGYIRKQLQNNIQSLDQCRNYVMTIDGIIFNNKGGFSGLYFSQKEEFKLHKENITQQLFKNKITILATIVGWVLAFVSIIVNA